MTQIYTAMRRIISFVLLTASVLSFVSCGEKKTELFNGKDLTGWTLFVNPDTGVPASEVFGVKDGVITISGDPYGFMMTEDSFGDYVLHVEWRWIGEPTNSGLFQRVIPAEKLWPDCAEVNLKAGSAGDMISFSPTPFEEMKESGGRFKTRISDEDVEKPSGEWNTAEIICEGTYIRAFINGVLKNEAHFVRAEGHIAIQSEGGPLEVRNVYITPVGK